jgi:23S rRNA (uracil1939-C5)-methyltransferase
MERRARQAAKKRSAARNLNGKQRPEAKQPAGKGAVLKGRGFSRAVDAQGMDPALQAAYKLPALKGHDFSRAVSTAKSTGPLGPKKRSSSAGKTAPARTKAAAAPQLVEIEKPIYGGAFLARVEGKAVFVPLVLPGEQARARITESKRGYAAAEAEATVRPSPERIAPACPHFGACGGCCYQHANYAAQLAFKQAILRETLERGGVAVPDEIAVLSGDPWRYRNRIRLAFDAAGRPGYRGRRSHAVVPVRECPIAAPLLVASALAFAPVARQFSLRTTELSLFCNAAETALLASVFTADPAKVRFDELAQALHEIVPALTGAELIFEGRPGQPPRTLAHWGAASLDYRAAGNDYRVDHGAFFQVNRWLVDSLVEKVTAGHSGHLAWDLFAGVGLFARQLAKRFERVVAVESAPAATAALTANLSGAGGTAINAETLDFLRKNRQPASSNAARPDLIVPDLIVLDPPRTGLGAETCALLADLAAPALACVSCDPATLARDLRALIASGYQIQSITLADLFPQTLHLETVVQLCRA